MKTIAILGSGTAGTMMAAHLTKKLDQRQWQIVLIDEVAHHYYQPGFLFIPFGLYDEKHVVKHKEMFIPKGVKFILAPIERIDHAKQRVLVQGQPEVPYDLLIIATGSKIRPEEVAGMKEEGWHKTIFDFYTFEGAMALRKKLAHFEGGDLVIHITEMPIKCPVAPLEFAFLMDWWLTTKRLRHKTNLTYVTPLSGAFTKQNCSTVLGYMLEKKKIHMIPDFAVEKIDPARQVLSSYDEQDVPYDLLITVPTNMGDEVIARSGLGDDLNFVPTDKGTLQAQGFDNIFVIGDATNVPASKAGSVAHFESEILTANILDYIAGKPLRHHFDGHANCFIESGFGKAVLIDFNYDLEPVEGKFPLPLLGPLPLLKESRLNHLGKLAFRYIYWNLLLKGLALPLVGAAMSRAGKKVQTLNKK